MLSANVNRKVLSITGSATDNNPFDRVIVAVDGTVTISDNGAARENVTVTGNTSDVAEVNARGITNAGVAVSFGGSGFKKIRGTDFNDNLSLDGGRGSLAGFDGDDSMFGGEGSDRLYGGNGDDQMIGNGGGDLFYGQGGNDTMNGGRGFDAAVFSGLRSEYTITNVNGRTQVSHQNGNGADGVDSLVYIDSLVFADGSINISTPPTNLTATSNGATLKVSGTGFDNNPFRFITITNSNGVIVQDNDATRTEIPISGNASNISSIDATGITNTGVFVNLVSTSAFKKIFGTEFNDFLTSKGGNATIAGYGGDDDITGGGGRDRLFGGDGRDFLFGGRGNDELSGQAGDDKINGGEGFDIARFAGNFGDYTISSANGRTIVSHLNGTGSEGVDEIVYVEQFVFADRTINVNTDPSNLLASANNGRVNIAGNAFANSPTNRLDIDSTNSAFTLLDNDAGRTEIMVDGDTSNVSIIDASRITGAGVNVTMNNSVGLKKAFGTDQSDVLSGANGNVVLAGNGGNDFLNGGRSADRLYGGSGNDTLDGKAGNDRLYGLDGNDTIDGGTGFDTLFLTQNRSEYEVSRNGDTYQVSHLNGTGYDGTDTFENIEALGFRDQTMRIDEFDFA
ncbi:calcium-binding protein [Profundibacterium mesophilum]|uniref:Glycerophosphoryl diester phosphodiesterase n=1 Tax=Profundibacterium mesophilum KAUST100406-0324 TaxID=1037889 RepID=A0A921NP37_9RHOB|nr:calcium-binding protein [Profundibacterium mesophilum]KAF0675651.1 glycerophosphoryl diester phosphodiesterase [Profundibacterium mesophilum KAUST100406-0324]